MEADPVWGGSRMGAEPGWRREPEWGGSTMGAKVGSFLAKKLYLTPHLPSHNEGLEPPLTAMHIHLIPKYDRYYYI